MKSAVLNELNYQFKTNINMKTKTSILALTKAFFILLVMCCFSCNLPDAGRRAYDFNPTVEIGQTWVGVDSVNPFRKISYDTVIVIDIKKNYAKVIQNGDTTSMRLDIVNWKRSLLK